MRKEFEYTELAERLAKDLGARVLINLHWKFNENMAVVIARRDYKLEPENLSGTSYAYIAIEFELLEDYGYYSHVRDEIDYLLTYNAMTKIGVVNIKKAKGYRYAIKV